MNPVSLGSVWRLLGTVWKVFGAVVGAWLVGSIVLQFAVEPLGAGFWLGALAAVILSSAGVVLAVQQGRLQERMANLELREKMTCFDSNRIHLEDPARGGEACAFTIVGDARSAIPLFASATRPVQEEFVDILRRALEAVGDRSKVMGADSHRELCDRAGRLTRELIATKSEDLRDVATEMSWALATG
jgi:hypothetical protein